MKKRIIFIIIGLIVVIGVTGHFNKSYIKGKNTMQEKELLTIKKDGKEVGTFDKEDLKNLGEISFDANLKSSGKPAEKHTYAGVPVKKIFDAKHIVLSDENVVIVQGLDGYTVALGIDEIMQEDNVYITYKMDGKPLGKKGEGGKGPYQIVIRKDPFSQRWCKFVEEIRVE
jgi:DMSO/TMAO reductase YedYZ molybdopterin-dependent catalytic subunit